MSKALVVGNGESRLNINLKTYIPEYTLIGCNAIHRDLTVDHLVCCDKRMASEATENPETLTTQIYVRESWLHYFKKIKKNKNINLLPDIPVKGNLKKDHPDHWGSGCYAVLLASSLGFKEIELVGFDLYPVDKSVNNVYKGTKNYSRPDSHPVDPSYWIYQMGQIFSHSTSQFIIRNHQTWKMPAEWQKDNVKFVAL